MQNKYLLHFKWTVSKARDSYGYNICTLYVNDNKVSRCNGGGYDMKGTCLGDFIAKEFEKELYETVEEPFYGLSFHNPNYDPGKAIIDGKTVEQREQDGDSLGLERYQAFYSASSKVPTEVHVIPLIDGSCGFSSVESIVRHLGYKISYTGESKNDSHYIMEKT